MTMPASERVLHPRHGIHDPAPGPPPRTPGSVRRTTTIDMLRRAGVDGPLELAGSGRDLLTGAGGPAWVLAEASCLGVVDFPGGRVLTGLSTSPRRPLEALLGASVSSGFRRRLDEADPPLADGEPLLYQLLDDFPVATLISGHAVAAQTPPGEEIPGASSHPGLVADLCAGFESGGTIMAEIGTRGRAPVVTGPEAPSLAAGDDPDAWHAAGTLPPGSMRRARRIDVTRLGEGADAAVDAMFRDSYVLTDGTETIIHEYALTARAADGVITKCEARPRVLPWVECPAASASASRLAGQPLRTLRSHVRSTFTGTSTCTHLNDMLRALADVPALLEHTGTIS